jgi:hypothetical protein
MINKTLRNFNCFENNLIKMNNFFNKQIKFLNEIIFLTVNFNKPPHIMIVVLDEYYLL